MITRTWNDGDRVLQRHEDDKYPYAWLYERQDGGWTCIEAYHGASRGTGLSHSDEEIFVQFPAPTWVMRVNGENLHTPERLR